MSKIRSTILELFRNGKRQCEIVKLLNVAQSTVAKAINRYKELGHEGDRPGRGRKPTVNVSRIRKIIVKRVHRNPRQSLRQLAQNIGISRESARVIAKVHLNVINKPVNNKKVEYGNNTEKEKHCKVTNTVTVKHKIKRS